MAAPTTPTPDNGSSVLVEVSASELRAAIEQILTAHPALVDFTPECECGSIWCGNHDLTAEEKRAYEELDWRRWLLGEK